ncbi:MAG: hypothetical protein M3N16_02345 [Actinomycetota bacterium]|nr:hypothetical protein [Actinomycetota bacterium]
MLAVSSWWFGGWILGIVVVIVASVLLIIANMLARRIRIQAEHITEILDSTRENTNPMFDIVKTNQALDRITRGLTAVRERDAR